VHAKQLAQQQIASWMNLEIEDKDVDEKSCQGKEFKTI
jgi:hypothetical protein